MNDKEILEIIKQILNSFILLSEGSFLMGSTPKDGYTKDNEFPQHLVTIQPFRMGKFVVTQEQWEAVTHLSKVDIELPTYPSYCKGDNLPVESIFWEEALEFCNRLSAFTGLNITLPSESQWEYACRAGTNTKYYWGDNPNPDLANYYKSKSSTPIDSYPANPWGLYAMHGNIFEWCLDTWHENYKNAPIDGNP